MTDSDTRADRRPKRQTAETAGSNAASATAPGAASPRIAPAPPMPPAGQRAAAVAGPAGAAPDAPTATKSGAPPTRSRPVTARPAGTPGSGLAVSALGALTALASQLGSRPPTTDTGLSVAAPQLTASDRPTGPIRWDGALGTEYAGAASLGSARANAMTELNSELAQLLGGTADTTAASRAALAALTADVDAAVTALGPIQNTPAAQQLLIDTLDHALRQAGTVFDRGQAGAALTAQQIEQLAERFQRESGAMNPAAPGGYSGGPPLTRPSGQVGQWIGDALNILAANGYDPRQLDPAAIATIIAHESAGNPDAINRWDSNAAAGHPSKGLMQTIDPTFDAYALPGHQNIWNPVDNIIAGVRYAIHRYGSLDAVPGIAHLNSGRGYVGY